MTSESKRLAGVTRLARNLTADEHSGAWAHPTRKNKRPGLIRLSLAMIAALAVIWWLS